MILPRDSETVTGITKFLKFMHRKHYDDLSICYYFLVIETCMPRVYALKIPHDQVP
jgi:hypothetical protein